ncbi:uncharacterized protein K02A2.6-like [Ornithodoros turicata]|uniref:uncharacterized protein K02A2.6-like n=1 Tax=Ornithodoros turicata TaxID=34597 RepID=UPI003138A90E
MPLLVEQGTGPCLLGRSWFDDLGIGMQGIHSFSDSATKWLNHKVFQEGLGQFTGPPVSVDITPDAIPIFKKFRPVPFALKEKVDAAIDKMVQDGVLEPVAYSKWATPTVPVCKRDGTIRICGDYKCTVNTGSSPDTYSLPTATEIFAILSNGKLFTKLDLNQAYLQLPLDENSSNILTLNKPRGLFRVKRLPFGVSAAPGIFQRVMDTMLKGIPGVATFLDDVIISGSTPHEHDQRVQAVLDKLRQAGLRVNHRKTLFAKDELEFLGFHINAKGIQPSKSKVAAIHNAPEPTNKKELQAFLGLVNFYERFLQNKATLLEPLNRLLDKNAKWD